MPAASFRRRSMGLAASGAIALSSVLLPSGVAQATTFDIDVTGAVDRTVTVPSTVCAVDWEIGGAMGGGVDGVYGAIGGLYGMAMYLRTTVAPGATLMIQPGQKGQSVEAADRTVAGAGGTSGTQPSGGSGGVGAGGGGGASIVRSGATVDSPLLLVAAGGGGSGTNAVGGDAFDWPEGSAYRIPPLTPGVDGPAISGGGPGDGARDRSYPGAPGSGGTPVNGATGITGEPGTALRGGNGPAGAGGGGGGVLGGGSGGSTGGFGSGGGAGSSFAKDVVETPDSYMDRNMGLADDWDGFVRGTYIPCDAAQTPAPSPAPVVAPATVPAADGPLATPQGSLATVAPGQTVTLTGSGYAPNSVVELYVYSTPQRLGSATADANGAFTAQVSLPTDLAPGAHSLVAVGRDGNGNARFLRMDVTLAVPQAARLAATGTSIAVPLLGAMVALGSGAALIAASRRRRTAA